MKNQRRSDVTTEIVVGAFMFAVMLALVSFSIVISQNKLFEKSYTLDVLFPNIGGLKEGEPVFMRGVKIGTVDRIDVEEGEGVGLQLRLSREPDLREDCRFAVKTSSMLGGMKLEIYEGSPALGAHDPSQALIGEPVVDIMDEAAETIVLLRDALTKDGILEDIRITTHNLAEMSEKVNRGTGTVAKLVNDGALYDEATALLGSLNQSSTNFTMVVADLREVSDRVARGKGFVGKLLSEDETLYNDITNTVANINDAVANLQGVMDRIEKGEGTMGKLLSPDDQVYTDLADTLASLKSFAGRLDADDGTLALLMTEDDLYQKVISLVDEARATIDDIRETSPITTFSSIFFGAF